MAQEVVQVPYQSRQVQSLAPPLYMSSFSLAKTLNPNLPLMSTIGALVNVW